MIEPRSRPAIGVVLRNFFGGGVIAIAAALAASAAQALDPLGNARVSYRADVVATADGQRYRGRLYHRHGMQRHEFPGQGITRILRFDLNRMWTIDHKADTYTEAVLEGLGAHAGVFDRRRLASELVGRAKVGKEAVERYRLRGVTSDRTQIDGMAWVTKDGILYRLDLEMRFVDARYAYRLELRNLRRVEVDQSLFDVPVGYRQVSRTPRWLPPSDGSAAAAKRVGADPIEKMTPTRGRKRPSRPTSTTSGEPPASREGTFEDGTTSKK